MTDGDAPTEVEEALAALDRLVRNDIIPLEEAVRVARLITKDPEYTFRPSTDEPSSG